MRIVCLVLVLTLVASASAEGDAGPSHDEAAARIAGAWQGQIDTPLPLEVVVRLDVDDGEVEHYLAMAGPVAGAPFEFTEVEGESVIVLGEGAVSYTFVRVE